MWFWVVICCNVGSQLGISFPPISTMISLFCKGITSVYWGVIPRPFIKANDILNFNTWHLSLRYKNKEEIRWLSGIYLEKRSFARSFLNYYMRVKHWESKTLTNCHITCQRWINLQIWSDISLLRHSALLREGSIFKLLILTKKNLRGGGFLWLNVLLSV